MSHSSNVFISGGTGYMGRELAARLVSRGHDVRVLARQGSEHKVPAGVSTVSGNALDVATFRDAVHGCDTFVHLTGVSRPAPWKERAYRVIDLSSLRASAKAAKAARVAHFVYVSVAHPAPVMKAYIRVRRECEEILQDAGLNATVLRPWYVVGPGHRWPVVLKPIYSMLESLNSTRDAARRLGLVTLNEMVGSLVWAVEDPITRTRVLDVPAIRSTSGRLAGSPSYDARFVVR